MKSMVLIIAGVGLTTTLLTASGEAQAQTCSGSVECGTSDDGRWVCSGNQTFTCNIAQPPDECAVNGWGTCTYIEDTCVGGGVTLGCSGATNQTACYAVAQSCFDCPVNSCDWDPGSGGGGQPTATPGGPSPTPWDCSMIAVGSCGMGNECSSVADCPNQPGWDCRYEPGQGSTPVCMHSCCSGGAGSSGCADYCNEATGNFCFSGFTCTPQSSIPPGGCPHANCCWKSTCTVPPTPTQMW